MTIERPHLFLTASGLTFSFDDKTLKVEWSAASTAIGTTAQRRILARNDLRHWLNEWACWLDRDREPAFAALANWHAAPVLRHSLGLAPVAQSWPSPWLRQATMPQMPQRASAIIGIRWLPAFLRRRARLKVSTYQRQHGLWLAQEQAHWNTIRQAAQQELEMDRLFHSAMLALRHAVDGADEGATATGLTSILAALSPHLAIEEISYPAPDEIAIRLRHLRPEIIEADLRYPAPGLEGLIIGRNELLVGHRLAELGRVAVLAVADLMMLLKSSRRMVGLTLDTDSGSEPLFSARFQAEHELAAAPRTIAAILARDAFPSFVLSPEGGAEAEIA